MQNREKLIYFDYFRGIAILLVIASHTFGNWQIDEKWEIAIGGLISGATALFVFISGFFFQYVFIENFQYKKFIVKKAKAILIPYLSLSLTYLTYVLLTKGTFTNVFNFEMSSFYLGVMKLVTGDILVAYWYIPFIILVFILSPLFVKFARSNIYLMLSITILFFIIAGLIHRSVHNINIIQNLIYFTAYYLLGIVYAKYMSRFDYFLLKYKYFIFLLFTTFLLYATLESRVSNLYKDDLFEITRFDYAILIKILTIFIILIFTKNISKYKISILSYFAKISFGLFFLHGITLSVYGKFGLDSFDFLKTKTIADFILNFLIVLILTILLVEITKLILKKKSVYLIGY